MFIYLLFLNLHKYNLTSWKTHLLIIQLALSVTRICFHLGSTYELTITGNGRVGLKGESSSFIFPRQQIPPPTRYNQSFQSCKHVLSIREHCTSVSLRSEKASSSRRPPPSCTGTSKRSILSLPDVPCSLSLPHSPTPTRHPYTKRRLFTWKGTAKAQTVSPLPGERTHRHQYRASTLERGRNLIRRSVGCDSGWWCWGCLWGRKSSSSLDRVQHTHCLSGLRGVVLILVDCEKRSDFHFSWWMEITTHGRISWVLQVYGDLYSGFVVDLPCITTGHIPLGQQQQQHRIYSSDVRVWLIYIWTCVAHIVSEG